MNRVIFALLCAVLFVGPVKAQDTAPALMNLCGMADQCAEYIADNVAGGAVLANNTYLKALDESANEHSLLGVDTSGNTELLAPTGEDIEATAGTDFDITATAGDVNVLAGDDVVITGTDDVVIQGQGSGDIVTIAGGGTAVDVTVADNLVTIASGTVLTGGAGSWGWVVATGANTACTTTCGISACIIGNNTAGGATTFAPVACSDATADQCICAGATS